MVMAGAMNGSADAYIEVVVVDDDSDTAVEISEFIEHLGHRTRVFSSARETLDHVNARSGAVILVSDLCMPGLSGLDLARFLHEDRSPHPVEIVLVSAHSGFGEAVEALQWGVIDFLMKPVALPQLEITLGRARAKLTERLAQDARRSNLEDLASNVLEMARDILGQSGNELAPQLAPPRPSCDPSASAAWDDRHRLALIKLFQSSRRWRDRMFACCGGGDPCWEIMLFVLEQEALGRTVSVTSACHAATIPQTTAIRKIDDLVGQGILLRHSDQDDRRRILLRASPKCNEMAEAYFQAVHKQILSTMRLLG